MKQFNKRVKTRFEIFHFRPNFFTTHYLPICLRKNIPMETINYVQVFKERLKVCLGFQICK